MALINCEDCGTQISDKAISCIKCGAPVIKKEVISCFECQAELEKGEKTCHKCGAVQENKDEPIEEEKFSSKEEETAKPFQSNNNQIKNVEKKRKSPIRIIFIILLVLALGYIGLIITNNPNSMPEVKFEVNTPKPIVLSSNTDGKESGLLNARITVHATVKNEGGAGNVIVNFNVSQSGNGSWDKSKSIYLAEGEVSTIDMTFEEINYIDGEIEYNVNASSL
jgi:hypothetical protein